MALADDWGWKEWLHFPGIFVPMIGVQIGALFMCLSNLRNARLWWLLLRGRPATGVVRAMEIVSDSSNVVLRRPKVEYATETGQTLTAAPTVYRTKTLLAAGDMVRLAYARRRPARIAVHGFDFRPSELAWAVTGLAVAVIVTWVYSASFH